MRVLVSDTSVLIDLERCGLLHSAFALEVEFVVPDVLYERELKDYNGSKLVAFGLHVAVTDAEGVAQAQAYRQRQSKLTLPDALALALAKSNGWTLLSGDGALRALAGQEGVECHGFLWLMDLLEREQAATIAHLRQGLHRLSNHPRCRLPQGEVAARLKRYAAASERDQGFVRRSR